MDERVIQFRVGVVVVAAACITLVLVVLFGAVPSFERQYTLHVMFLKAPGVDVHTPVRKSGVDVGRVSRVHLLKKGGVVLSMKINEKYELFQAEVCRISSGSLVTGDAVLEWVTPVDTDDLGPPLSDGEFLTNGQVQTDPFQVLVNLESRMSTTFTSIEDAARSIESTSGELGNLVRGLSTGVNNNQDQLKRIMQKTELSLDQFRTAMSTIDEVVGDPEVREGLQRSLRGLPELFDESKATMGEFRTAIQGFQNVAAKANTNLDNLEKFTRPLGERGEELVGSVQQTLTNLDSVLLELREFSKSLNNREGTIGQLVHNPELYNRLNRVVANVEDVTGRLRPIVNDVRVFTDKIARDPRQLGIKGALDRRPLGGGRKSSSRSFFPRQESSAEMDRIFAIPDETYE